MTISLIATATAEANTVAAPSHQRGDLIVVGAFRWNSPAGIGLPVGYGLIGNRQAGQFSLIAAAKIAATHTESVGVFGNATHIIAAVYRSDNSTVLSQGAGLLTSAASASMSYPSLNGGSTLEKRVIAFGASIINSTAVDTPPGNMQLAASIAGATNGELALHNSIDSSNWAGGSVAIASTQWGTIVCELVDMEFATTSGTAGFTGIRGISRRLGT